MPDSDMPLIDLIVSFKNVCVAKAVAHSPEDATELHDLAEKKLALIKQRIGQPIPEERAAVYSALNSERDYQDEMTASHSRPDMIENFNVGDGLSAIEWIMHDARRSWYSGSAPYADTMGFLRKVGGVIVKLGEQYGMPERGR